MKHHYTTLKIRSPRSNDDKILRNRFLGGLAWSRTMNMDSNRRLPQQCILRHRQLSLDPEIRAQAIKKRLYSNPSFVKRFKVEKRLEKHQGCVNCINFSHSGQLLASGSDDLRILLWDWAKGSVVGNFQSKHLANVFQVT